MDMPVVSVSSVARPGRSTHRGVRNVQKTTQGVLSFDVAVTEEAESN